MKRKYNVDHTLFTDNITPHSAYVLGLLWADGYVCSNKTSKQYGDIRFVSTYPDADHFSEVLKRTGVWGEYCNLDELHVGWKPRFTAYVRNRDLADFLLKNDYGSKTTCSADKILTVIPINLRRFFFLGVVDGDGCFSMTPTKKGYYNRRFSVTSSVDQNWGYFEHMLKSIGTSYKIERCNRSTGSFSKIHVGSVDDIDRIGTFLYQTQDVDDIGLRRKYLVFKEICSSGRRKTSKYKHVIRKKNGKWMAYGLQKGGKNAEYLGTFETEEAAAIAAGSLENVTATSGQLGIKEGNTVAFQATNDGYNAAYCARSTSFTNYIGSVTTGQSTDSLFTEKR